MYHEYWTCIKYGELEFLKYLPKDINLIIHHYKLYEIACEFGQLECLDYILHNFKGFNLRNCFELSIKNNHLHIVKYFHESIDKLENEKSLIKNDSLVGIVNIAIKYNNLECLKYLEEYGYLINSLCIIQSIIYNSLECLKYLKNDKNLNWPIAQLIIFPHKINKIEKTLKYAIENGYYCDSSIYSYIISEKNLELFMAYHSTKTPKIWNIPFGNINLCEQLAIAGALELLKWAYENGAPLGNSICDKAYDVSGIWKNMKKN